MSQNPLTTSNATSSTASGGAQAVPVSIPASGAAGTTTSTPIITDQHGERYWQIFQNNVDWLRFSETKAGLILTLYGVLFTIFYANAEEVFKSVDKSTIILAGVILYSVVSLSSIVFAFLAVRPRMKAPGENVIYFRHISKFPNPAAYRAEAHAKLNDAEEYATHITDQIYYVSKIANTKFIYTAWSLWAFAASVVILLFSVTIYALDILIK
jgi:hypothetical protein